MKKLLLAVAGLTLAVSAHATNLTWGAPHRVFTTSTVVKVPPVMGEILMGVNPVDTSGVPFLMSSSGYLMTAEGDRDRNYSTVLNLLSSVNINAGNAASNSVDPPTTDVFSKGTLLVTWAYAPASPADSDSVNIAVYVSQKTSAQSGIKYNLAYTPTAGSAADSLWAYHTAGFQQFKPIPTYYITRNSLQFLSFAGSLSANPIRFPIGIYRLGASSTGIAIPLGDLSGLVVPGKVLEITVANLHPRKNLGDVQVDLWPRVW